MTRGTKPQVNHNIRPEIRDLAEPVDTITPHPQNYRIGDVDGIADSLAENGQYKPIVVQDSTGYACVGNNTLAAAVLLGWTHVAATRLDIDDDTARRILAADNGTSDRARNDERALAALLTELESGDGLRGAGYDAHHLDELLASLDPPPVAPVAPAIAPAAAPLVAPAAPAAFAGTHDPDHVQTRPSPDADHLDDAPDPPISRPDDLWLLGGHTLHVDTQAGLAHLYEADALCRGWQAMTDTQPLLRDGMIPIDFHPPALAATTPPARRDPAGGS